MEVEPGEHRHVVKDGVHYWDPNAHPCRESGWVDPCGYLCQCFRVAGVLALLVLVVATIVFAVVTQWG